MNVFVDTFWGQWLFDGLGLLVLVVIVMVMRSRR